MQKVLIIGPNFHYFIQSISRAFINLGWQVHTEAFDTPIHPYTFVNQCRYKVGDKARLKDLSRLNYKPYIERIFEDYRPDLVFVINGDNLLPESLNLFRQHAQVAVWLFDSIVRMPQCSKIVPAADTVFCYEQTDIPLIKQKYGIDAHFLPQAADQSLYYSTNTSKKMDIVFAGDIYQSKKRQQFLQAIVAHFPNKKIKIWGVYKPWYKNPWRWLWRERRDVYKNCNTNAQTLNNDYNNARVVVNIHHEQQQNGANPKVYEICASGAYQICDANPYIKSLFGTGEVGLYNTKEELITLIEDALAHDKLVQAAKAHQIVVDNHTFEKRMAYMLQILKKSAAVKCQTTE